MVCKCMNHAGIDERLHIRVAGNRRKNLTLQQLRRRLPVGLAHELATRPFVPGVDEEALVRAFRSVLRAAALLEKEPALGGKYRFQTDRIEIGISDRLRAPSNEKTLAALRPALESALKAVYGKPSKSMRLASGRATAASNGLSSRGTRHRWGQTCPRS